MDLVQEYFALANEVTVVNRYDKSSVAEYNQKKTRMRKIAADIENNHVELKNVFCELLFCDNQEIQLWVAHHILEVLKCEKTYRKAALKIIKKRARTDKSANGYGEKIWLKEWYEEHPKDRWITF